jgi:hypothetical protein
MKTKLFTLLSLFFFLLLSSCQSSLEDYDYIFVGSWESNKFYLEIYDDGYGYIEKYGLFGFDGEEGEVTIRRDRIIIDTPNHTKRFKIDASPFYDAFSDQVIMILDGKEFYKL